MFHYQMHIIQMKLITTLENPLYSLEILVMQVYVTFPNSVSINETFDIEYLDCGSSIRNPIKY